MSTKSATPIEETSLLDDHAVDLFSKALKDKLRIKREQGFSGWNDISSCSGERLAELLLGAVAKGDPVDVANFAMMLFCRHESHNALKTAYATIAAGAADSARYKWILPILTGGDDTIAQLRTMRLAGALMLGLSGDAAVDHAMNIAPSQVTS